MPDVMPEVMRGGLALVEELLALLGPRGVLTGADAEAACVDWRGMYHGRTPAVVRPGTTEEVAAVVRLCAGRGVAIVPQGGNTSMAGGATPDASGTEIVLSLARMAAIRDLDPLDRTLTIEAGATWRAAQIAAEEAGCLLPLSIGSEGTAQVGGILSANAGGNTTIRYGNARELVLGLEVVLPDGQVWHGLRSLRKDNTGYHLRGLFVGAEGTLGVITAAVLRLAPGLHDRVTALCALPSAEAAAVLFRACHAAEGGALQAFEYMSGAGMAMVLAQIPGTSLPFAAGPHYALIELASTRAGAPLRDALEAVLERAMEDGTVQDVVLAESGAQRAALWRLREEHTEAQKRAGANIKNDISVPPHRVPELLARATAACEAAVPGIRVAPFGHLGDGNIHFNLLQPVRMDGAAFLARTHEVMDTVNGVVRELGGSFSAEHGVGRLKTGMMAEWRGGAELDLMQRIKRAIDPAGIMNPGKVLP